ncbi:MAG: serine/threonine-protein kinase [Gemmatimonadaceae bacterium]
MTSTPPPDRDLHAERWERAQAIFHDAVERPRTEWEALIAQASGGDETLVREVLDLLDSDSRDIAILDAGVEHAAQQILEWHDDEFVPTEMFGAWRATARLGEGGMGVVYRATRDDLGSVAAVKVLRDAWLSPARRRRFADEQRTLARLVHPCIARLYDAGTSAEGTPWFVMEYVEGRSLTAYCRETNAGLRERLRLFHEVCEAVRHAHQHLVMHRDLKPSNILVTTDGSVKLLDFGISKQLVPLDDDGPTRTGLQLMTPAYAAPEQLRGGDIGVHTDVYSLGIVLYELLAGRVPFEIAGRTSTGIAEMITTREAERPSTIARNSPQSALTIVGAIAWSDLDVLCLTAIQKDPARRYRSVEALIRDVDHFVAGQPLEARPDSLRYRATKFARRNARDVTLTVVALVVIVAMTTLYLTRLATARNEALVEAGRAHRIQRFMLSLFNAGDEMAAPAESLRVLDLLARGVHDAGALSAEPVVQGELLETLGSVYMQLGELSRADSLLQASLTKRRNALPADHPDVSRGMMALGLLRDAQAEYAPAESLVRAALATSKRTLPPSHPAIARTSTALGRVLENRGEYAAAIPVLEEAARLHMARSDLPEAEQYYRQAVDIFRAWYGTDNPETASSLTMLGRVLVSEKRLDEANTLLTQALAITEHVYGPVHPRVASALNELGRISQKRGNLDEPERDFQRTADVYRKVYADKHYLIGVALSNLAGVRQEKRDNAGAERTFREVLRRYADVLAPDHQLVGIAKIRLGRAILRQGRAADAEHESNAGLAIILHQTQPPASWMQFARTDLAAEYDALGRSADAGRVRRELADSAKAPASK